MPSVVEKPHLYILGRCGSKEIEQLAYVDTKQECLDGLAHNIETRSGMEITAVMQFLHGDGPEHQCRNGVQESQNRPNEMNTFLFSGETISQCNLVML